MRGGFHSNHPDSDNLMRNIILTVLIVLSVVFAMQNMHPVELVFIVWSVHTVTALAIIVALILGILIGLLLALPAVIRNKRAAKHSKQQVSALESALSHQESLPNPEDSPMENPQP